MKIIKKPKKKLGNIKRMDLYIPEDMKIKMRIICEKRNITMSKYIKELIKYGNKKYNYLLKSI